jgi:hypothetical protein
LKAVVWLAPMLALAFALTFDGAGAGAGLGVASAELTLLPAPCGEGAGPDDGISVGAAAGAAGASAEPTLFPDPWGDGGEAAQAADETSKQPATTRKDFVMTLPPDVYGCAATFWNGIHLNLRRRQRLPVR